jgi:hypothetical protein
MLVVKGDKAWLGPIPQETAKGLGFQKKAIVLRRSVGQGEPQMFTLPGSGFAARSISRGKQYCAFRQTIL